MMDCLLEYLWQPVFAVVIIIAVLFLYENVKYFCRIFSPNCGHKAVSGVRMKSSKEISLRNEEKHLTQWIPSSFIQEKVVPWKFQVCNIFYFFFTFILLLFINKYFCDPSYQSKSKHFVKEINPAVCLHSRVE